MIEYITGTITELTPASAVIETAAGVAFYCNITLQCYDALQGKQQARLLVHEAIREDAWVLYGFADARERELFRELIGVSGVGAASARILLSSLSTAELSTAIENGDETRLKAVKGIGKKTAQRIIVDLQGKIKGDADALLEKSLPNSIAFDESLAALVALGFQKQAAQKALQSIFGSNPQAKVDEAIRQALAML